MISFLSILIVLLYVFVGRSSSSFLPPSITTLPIFYFPLNGSYTDISGNNNVITLSGTTTGYGFVTDSVYGYVYNQNSRTSGAYGGLLTNVITPIAFTSSIWVMVNQYDLLANGSINPQQTPQYLFGSYLTDVNDSTMSTLLFSDQATTVVLTDQNFGQNTFSNIVQAADSTWLNIISTFDANGNFTVYKNGVVTGVVGGQISSTALTLLQSLPKANVTIGFDSVYSTTPNNVFGKLRDAMLFNYALNQTQATDLYTFQLTPTPIPSAATSSSSSNLALILGTSIGGAVAVLMLAAGLYYMYSGKGDPNANSRRNRMGRSR